MFDRNVPYNDLPLLPPRQEVETKAVLKLTTKANLALSELKNKALLLPNQDVLIHSLTLFEAKDSSEIEGIFTTHDKLFQADVLGEAKLDATTKEVVHYRRALWKGAELIKHKPLSTNIFISIFQSIKHSSEEIRKTSGTKIASPVGQVIYTPPEGEDLLRRLLHNLEQFINNDGVPEVARDMDALIKMAILHYQFEAIHPFSDGNGRTGRILNILYLMQEGLLRSPILFLSRYIIENKDGYYKGLKAVTEDNAWEEWILYMLRAIESTSWQTIKKIDRIVEGIDHFIEELRNKVPKLCSKELVELLFMQPYCRIKDVEEAGIAKRVTASNYLATIEEIGLIRSFKFGTERIFVNSWLEDVLIGG